MKKEDLLRLARDKGFVRAVEGLGFLTADKQLLFYRRRGELIDVIQFWLKSSGNWVEVYADVFIEKLLPKVDTNGFPKCLDSLETSLSNMGLSEDGVESYPESWKVKSDDDVQETFDGLFDLIKTELMAWFDSIATLDKVYEILPENIKNGSKSSFYKKILLGVG
jgi:hypothetical protein